MRTINQCNSALVTAAASGIGREIVRAFVASGAKLFVCDIDAKGLELLAQELPGHIPIPKQMDLPISYNIAPSQNALAIREIGYLNSSGRLPSYYGFRRFGRASPLVT